MSLRSAVPYVLSAIALLACDDPASPARTQREAPKEFLAAIDPTTLCCALQWNTSARFISVTPLVGVVSTPLGLPTISYGTPTPITSPQSSLTFTGLTKRTPGGTFPSAGQILNATFFNGTLSGGAITGGEFAIDLEGCTPVTGGCTSEGIVLGATVAFTTINTTNSADSIASSDGLFIPNADPPISLWVVESRTAQFALYYQIRSPLQIVHAELVSGSGFVGLGTTPVPVTPLVVDIKPGSDDNSIHPGSRGKTPVAILGSATFDVTTIDMSSLRFGPLEAVPGKTSLEDVNLDGIMDLLMHVETPATGIACGDAFAVVSGKKTSGGNVRGGDQITTVGCNQ